MFIVLTSTKPHPEPHNKTHKSEGRVAVDDQEVVPVSERLMGGL